MKEPTAIFDLDGTLADTVGDLVHAANSLLAPMGIPPLDAEACRNQAGMGGKALVRLAHGLAGRELAETAMEDLYRRFLDHYDRNLCEFTRLFDEVPEGLNGLRQSGWRLGVCTNKPESPARRLLARLGIADFFDAILGGNSLDVRKPHPRHLVESVRRSGGDPGRAVMVGDSAIDLEAARAAGIPCILVAFGYSTEPVETLGADAVVQSFAEVPERVAGLLPDG